MIFETGDEDDEDAPKKKLSRKEKLKANFDKYFGGEGEEGDELDEEVKAYKNKLQSLKEEDPSFFAHLMEEGGDALDFTSMSEAMKEKKREEGLITTVTSQLLQEWIQKAIEEVLSHPFCGSRCWFIETGLYRRYQKDFNSVPSCCYVWRRGWYVFFVFFST